MTTSITQSHAATSTCRSTSGTTRTKRLVRCGSTPMRRTNPTSGIRTPPPVRPSERGSADAVGGGNGGVLQGHVPFEALAADASGAGEDPGGAGQRDGCMSPVRGIVDSRGRPSRLGSALFSRLPQTGLAYAAHAARRGVSLRVRQHQGRFGRRDRAPFPAERGGRMVRSDGLPGRVDGTVRCRARGLVGVVSG